MTLRLVIEARWLNAGPATAAGPVPARRAYAVRVEGKGHCGWGEAAPMTAFGTEDEAACGDLLRRCAAMSWLFDEAKEGRGFWDEAAELVLDRHPAARFAIEGACVDRAARIAGVPLSAWLADSPGFAPGQYETRVDSHQVVPDGSVPATLPRGLHWKVKVGARAPADERAALDALRRATGGELRLRLDANGAFTDVATAAAHLLALGLSDVDWVEQPLRPGRLDLWADLARRVPTPLVPDEEVSGPATLQATLDSVVRLPSQGSRTVVLKPHRIGGPVRAVAWAKRCVDRGVVPCVTHFMDGPIGRRTAIHLAAAVDRLLRAEGQGAGVHGLKVPGWGHAPLVAGGPGIGPEDLVESEP